MFLLVLNVLEMVRASTVEVNTMKLIDKIIDGDAPILPAIVFGDSVKDDAGSASPSSEDFAGGNTPNTNPTGLPMLLLGGSPKPPKGLGLLLEPEPKGLVVSEWTGWCDRIPNSEQISRIRRGWFRFFAFFYFGGWWWANKNEGIEVEVDEVPPKRVELGGLALNEPNDRVADDDPKEELLKLKLGLDLILRRLSYPKTVSMLSRTKEMKRGATVFAGMR
jgi:hypothetical protein